MPSSGYFDKIFAQDGDLTPVPDAAQTDGTVSYDIGYGPLYEAPQTSGGIDIERTKMNQILHDVTSAIQTYQQFGTPPFITSSMNGGTPFSYAQYARVLSGGIVYQSLVGSNTDTPPSAKWVAVSSSANIGGSFRNLKINTISSVASTITADALLLSDSSGNVQPLTTVNKSYSTAVSGVGGLDTGSIAASTWYYEYIIYNPTTLASAALLSLSATTPTLPSGYTFFMRVGAILTDGSSVLYRKLQYARDAQYVVGTNPAFSRAMITGISGNPTSGPTYTSVAVGAFVPPTASKIRVSLNVSGSGAVHAIAAPNNNYGIVSSGAFVSNTVPAGNSGFGSNIYSNMNLESSNVYYAADANPAGLFCLGWTDNL